MKGKNPPIIRVAPLGQLNAYTVYEHQLDQLGKAQVESLCLNFGLCLASVFATVLVTLLTVDIPAGKLFQGFFSTCIITGIGAILLLLLWWKGYRSSGSIIQEIKSQMPPPPGIQEAEPSVSS